jgi:hypothetical protein
MCMVVVILVSDFEFPTRRFDIFIWLYNNNTYLQISNECMLTSTNDAPKLLEQY